MKAYLLKYRDLVFLVFLLAFYVYIDYFNILFFSPQGTHFIRQTDGLSFVVNYVRNGFDFFEPMVFNLQSEGGKAAAEFPLLYYFTAVLYSLFGEQEWMLRGMSLLVISCGALALFRLLFRIMNDLIFALLFSFLFISSGVFLYYGNNFLPDAAALGFTLVGWNYFYKYLMERDKRSSRLPAFIFFSLGSLLKVTYFMNPLAAILSLVVYDLSTGRKPVRVFTKERYLLLLFLASFVLVLSWNIFSIYYNQAHHDHYFLTEARPIWSLGNEEIRQVWGYMRGYWANAYYYPTSFHFLGVLFLAGWLFIGKARRALAVTSLILGLGSLVYFMLFYSQFRDHDYYFLAFIPAIIFISIHSFIAVRTRFPKWINNGIFRLALLVICVLSLNYGAKKLDERYLNSRDVISEIGFVLRDSKAWIDGLGIPDDAKFIVYTDLSPNGGLYFIQRPGWNIRNNSAREVNKIDRYIAAGAEYLLDTGISALEEDERLEYLAEKGQVKIYRIKRAMQ